MSLSERFDDDALFLEAVKYRIERCGSFPDDMIKDHARLIEILRKQQSK
jgi:hypothetical protein